MCAFALNLIGDCMLAELKILGKELKLDVAIPNFKQILEKISNVQVYAFSGCSSVNTRRLTARLNFLALNSSLPPL